MKNWYKVNSYSLLEAYKVVVLNYYDYLKNKGEEASLGVKEDYEEVIFNLEREILKRMKDKIDEM